MDKTFRSFFRSDFNVIYKHEKFLELDVILVQKLLRKPRVTRLYDKKVCGCGKRVYYSYILKERKLAQSVEIWINHDISIRKKYEKDMLTTIIIISYKFY